MISTVHRAKGLEWKRVKVANVFRLRDTDGSPMLGEDELRLLYVAVTRAKHVLDISGWGIRTSRALCGRCRAQRLTQQGFAGSWPSLDNELHKSLICRQLFVQTARILHDSNDYPEYGEVMPGGRAALEKGMAEVLERLSGRLPAILIDTLREQ